MALTAAGIKHIAQSVLGLGTAFDAAHAYIGIGNGTAAFSADQTGLTGTLQLRKPMDEGYPKVDGQTVTFKSTFAPDEGNFNWEEWGVFNDGSNGVMLNRTVESNGTKQNGQTWVLEVEITFDIGS